MLVVCVSGSVDRFVLVVGIDGFGLWVWVLCIGCWVVLCVWIAVMVGWDGWLLLLVVWVRFRWVLFRVCSVGFVFGFCDLGLRVADYFGLVCGALWCAVGCTWCGFVLRIVVFWWFGLLVCLGLLC